MADKLDQQINRALTSYSRAEPLAGMDQRILEKVSRTAPQKKTGAWLAAAAVLLAIALLLPNAFHKTQPPSHLKETVLSAARPRTGATSKTAPARVRVVRSRQFHHHNRPTPEELLLARYVASDPEGAIKAFQDLQAFVDRDLTIQPLTVEPIKIESLH